MFLSALCLATTLAARAEPTRKILFFTKSSGFEHSVISWKNGKPSFAEKVIVTLGGKHAWEFEFSKDGSKFSPEYLAGFDTVIFYTTGDLTIAGKDGEPPMTAAGKQALLDYIKGGKGFIGLHSATDTFKSAGPADKPGERYLNHGKDADPFICCIGGEFISHGEQQVAKNTVTDPKFPGFESLGESFSFNEEWYSLRDFNPDIHVLTVIDSPAMKGSMYDRPPFPTSWARMEGKGRVFYTALGHREDVWTNPIFQKILFGAIRWTLGDVDAAVPANLEEAAPGATTNPIVPAPKK